MSAGWPTSTDTALASATVPLGSCSKPLGGVRGLTNSNGAEHAVVPAPEARAVNTVVVLLAGGWPGVCVHPATSANPSNKAMVAARSVSSGSSR